MKIEDLKEGDLVWWTAERYCKDWDVPAIYRGIKPKEEGNPWSSDSHLIESLDDGTITSIAAKTVEKEIKPSSLQKHKNWFQNRIHSIDGSILQLNQKIEDLEIKKQEIRDRMNAAIGGKA